MSEDAPSSPQSLPPLDGWELACSGILRTEFGRRRSRALTNALVQLAAEEAWAGARAETAPGWRERLRGWFAALQPAPKFALGAALLVVLTAVAWFSRTLYQGGYQVWSMDSLCVVYDAVDVRWAPGSPQPEVGDVLEAGTLRLEAGLLQLKFPREEKIAIEGPAQLELTGHNSVRLENGNLAAQVPRSGVGFIVTTSFARLVDLGTQFGVRAADEASEVAVFEGRVHLTADGSGTSHELTPNMAVAVDRAGTMKPTTLSAAAFPQVGRAIQFDPENCGFDEFDRMRRGGMPTAFGFWSGPACTVSGPVHEVRPFRGPGMLRFLTAPSGGAVQSAGPARSEVWQLLDLGTFKEMMVDGAHGKLSATFNRVRGDRGADSFGLTLAAFRGHPEDAAELWLRRSDSALALIEDVIVTDADPTTWEKFEIGTTLPAETDFLVVELRAIGPAAETGVAPAFPGHFADDVVFKLRVPLRASSLAAAP